METDKLKQSWREAGEDMNTSGLGTDAPFNPRIKTSLQRLALRYRAFTIFTWVIACITAASVALPNANITDPLLTPVVKIAFELFFITASIMDYSLYRGIKSIDCTTMSVDSVLRATLRYRKRHFLYMMVLMPCAIAIFCCMVFQAKQDVYMIYSMVAGFLLGLAIGLKQFLDFMRDYRNIIR